MNFKKENNANIESSTQKSTNNRKIIGQEIKGPTKILPARIQAHKSNYTIVTVGKSMRREDIEMKGNSPKETGAIVHITRNITKDDCLTEIY
jgi:hypothetical protein